jgi:hypothetical protein
MSANLVMMGLYSGSTYHENQFLDASWCPMMTMDEFIGVVIEKATEKS